MSEKNSILLISDDANLAELLRSKLIFLRKDDSVLISDYDSAEQNFELSGADIVLIHENSSKNATLELVKSIRRKNLNAAIFLLINDYDEELVLACYDVGIDDFAMAGADAFELVIRTVNDIKHNSIKLKAMRNTKLLEQLHVVDDLTGLYNYNFAKQVIENVIDDNLIDFGSFMVISPSEEAKSKFSVEKMAKAICGSIRVDDVATFGRGAKFYIFLPKTDFNGSIVVLNKIKASYGEDFELSVGISGITHKTFDEMEKDGLQALSDALATNAEYVFAKEKEDDTLDDWLDELKDEPKNYKIFRKIFNKKLEKVIIPVFYRLQKSWEEKLFETEIRQSADDEMCVFHLKNKKQDSTLRIVYPGFAKIIISITHEGLDSPENKEIQLPLTKISQKELVAIVEDFIINFKYTSE